MQRIAARMKSWVLMFAAGIGVLGIASAFLQFWLLASTLISIVFVSLTLYWFLKYWPEDGDRPTALVPAEEEGETPRRALVPVVRPNAPARTRFMVALREVVRRQEDFRLSPQGAERFAKTIRYILQSTSDHPEPRRRRTGGT
jgi:hypothetical protein